MNTMTDADDFAEFMTRRLQASTSFVNGDIAALHQISARSGPATLFGPGGTIVEGADQVNAVNAEGAAMFRPDDTTTNVFQVLHQRADGHLAYWVGVQRSKVHLAGHDQPTSMSLRISEIFARQDGQWTLIHRHADTLAHEPD